MRTLNDKAAITNSICGRSFIFINPCKALLTTGKSRETSNVVHSILEHNKTNTGVAVYKFVAPSYLKKDWDLLYDYWEVPWSMIASRLPSLTNVRVAVYRSCHFLENAQCILFIQLES